MKITDCQTRLVRVPYDGERTGTHLVLQLHTDEGVEGFGYTSFAGGGPWAAKALSVTAEALVGQIAGQDPLNTEALSAKLSRGAGHLAGLVNQAASMIDVALWDIRGKALGKPVWQLLGGHKDRVRVYGGWKLWWQLDNDTIARNAAWFAEQGFTAIKYRLGGLDSAHAAAERTKIIREAAGPKMDLLTDINQSWDVKQVLRIAPELEQYRLFYIEDPVSHHDYEGLREISAHLDTPVAAGESYHSSLPFRELLERRAIDIVMVDLIVGGLTPWIKIAHMAEAYGKPVVSHLCPEILAHGIAAIPNGIILEYLPWASLLFKEPPQIKDGEMILTDKPGLGLEIDEAAMSRFAIA